MTGAPPSSTPQADAKEETARAEFRGAAKEYFRIWASNVFLTVITAGFYSPWAKVRNKRYFYGNAWLGGANFEYHANPLSILAARVVLLAALIGGAYWVGTDNYRDAGYSLILALVLPWALARGLAFNARNSSFAAMRFSFNVGLLPLYIIYSPFLIINGLLFYNLLADGLQWERYSAHLRDIIIIVLYLAILLLLPYLVCSYHKYKAGRHALGKLRFYLHNPPALSYYGALVIPLVIMAAALFVPLNVLDGLADNDDMSDAEIRQYLNALFVFIGVMLLSVFVFMQFMQAALFRLFWDNLRARGESFEARFVCDIGIWDFAFRILTVNTLAVIFSLGWLYPWAKVRQTKYLIKHIRIVAPAGALASLTAKGNKDQSALGEELDVAEGFDFDVGLI